MTDSPAPSSDGATQALRGLLQRFAWFIADVAFVGTVALGVTIGGLVYWLEAAPRTSSAREVRDVTQLIRIQADRVVHPEDTETLQHLITAHDGPISIGGGRYSMGGQIGTDGTLFIDMRAMRDVLDLSVAEKVVKVEAGITWRALIEQLDQHDLSVQIMQSYANFTVGGSLSVNAHGRYVNEGPLVHSVRALELVLADGSLVSCSRTENPELFWGAVGGYGALGAIATVELDLVPNTPMERTVSRLTLGEFEDWFAEHVEDSAEAILFNADLYPPEYTEMVAITFEHTDRAPTIEARLQEGGPPSKAEQAMVWWVSEAPLGKKTRSEIIDPLRLRSQPVLWRNYEATYDVAGLEPGSREQSTYVLQEYFIPREHFTDFTPRMAQVFDDHKVNVINVSIRHASAEPDSLLTWAPGETFAFVIYYKMDTTEAAWQHAQTWTRAMNDAILEVGGRWYLPYQIHATPEQFHQAYPRASELFALKRVVDPDYTFRNRLWDTYLPPSDAYGGVSDTKIRERLAQRASWTRPEDQTFLTLPEWLIVYSADELGAFLVDHRPSEFPYFAAIEQFWTNYRAVWGRVRDEYSFNTGYHVMIGVIGASYTVEMAAKGLYEHTLGSLFETGPRVPEEDAYARITQDYGAFTHHTPWYAFPFVDARADLTSEAGPGLRGTERRVVGRIELTLKSWWARCIERATGTAYAPEAETLEVWVRGDRDVLHEVAGLTYIESLGGNDHLIALPRYEPFTAAALDLAERGIDLVSVAGGDRILVQVEVPSDWDRAALWGTVLIEWPLLSDPARKRVALEVATARVDDVLRALRVEGVTVEHLYDF